MRQLAKSKRNERLLLRSASVAAVCSLRAREEKKKNSSICLVSKENRERERERKKRKEAVVLVAFFFFNLFPPFRLFSFFSSFLLSVSLCVCPFPINMKPYEASHHYNYNLLYQPFFLLFLFLFPPHTLLPSPSSFVSIQFIIVSQLFLAGKSRRREEWKERKKTFIYFFTLFCRFLFITFFSLSILLGK